MSKIDKLTPEQQVQHDTHKAEYLAHGLSTQPINKDEIKPIIDDIYALTEYKTPEIHYVASPYSACVLLSFLEAGKTPDPNDKSVKIKKFTTYFRGSMDLYWVAYYTFAERYLGVKYRPEDSRKLDIMDRLGKACGWVYLFDNVCVVCDRPELIKFDDEMRLHNESGPAIRFRDGWEIYKWRGVGVPDKWITDKAITPQEALTWRDVEQRNAACQILGWDKILESVKAKVVDEDPNPFYGTLLEAKLPDHGKQKFLRARCGTGRDVVILADNNAKTAKEAGAMSYGIPVEDYDPTART